MIPFSFMNGNIYDFRTTYFEVMTVLGTAQYHYIYANLPRYQQNSSTSSLSLKCILYTILVCFICFMVLFMSIILQVHSYTHSHSSRCYTVFGDMLRGISRNYSNVYKNVPLFCGHPLMWIPCCPCPWCASEGRGQITLAPYLSSLEYPLKCKCQIKAYQYDIYMLIS